jgi:hypothetical protein
MAACPKRPCAAFAQAQRPHRAPSRQRGQGMSLEKMV